MGSFWTTGHDGGFSSRPTRVLRGWGLTPDPAPQWLRSSPGEMAGTTMTCTATSTTRSTASCESPNEVDSSY